MPNQDALFLAFYHTPHFNPPREVSIRIDLGLREEARCSVNSLTGRLAIQEVRQAINVFEYSKET
jgi:hypothetical protein